MKAGFAMKKHSTLAGNLTLLVTAFLWSTGGLLIKYIPWSSFSIASIRGLISTLALLWLRRLGSRPEQRAPLRFSKYNVAAGAAMFLTSTLFLAANKLTTAANAIVLQYLAPAVVILLSAVFLGLRPGRRDVVMVALATLGMLLFFLDTLGSGRLLGDLLAIVTSFTFAMVFLANRMPGANALEASYLGCALNVLLIPALLSDPMVPRSSPLQLLVILLMGTLQTGLAYVVFSRGIRQTSAVSASIISMIEPILNPLWVFLWLGERPSALALSGGAIVLLAVTGYNILISREQERRQVKA